MWKYLIHLENGVVDGGVKLEKLFSEYDHSFLIEEVVKQHADMAALNPDSVNTIRVVTYCSEMDIVVLYTAIRIGRGR